MVGGVAHGGKRRRVGHPHRPHQRHLAHTVSTAAIGRPHHRAVMQCMLRMFMADPHPAAGFWPKGRECGWTLIDQLQQRLQPCAPTEFRLRHQP